MIQFGEIIQRSPAGPLVKNRLAERDELKSSNCAICTK